MRCQEIQNKLALYLDNQLSDHESAEIEQHLSICSVCIRELEVLKSIDALGQVETFAEPEPEYWNQLRHNVMRQIVKPEEKTSWFLENLAQLKRVIWHERISYRLVGLAATAVIVFFIVRISFMHYGKFEAPIEISMEDSTEISATKKLTIPDQPLIESREKIPEEKRKAKTAPPAQDKDAGLLKAQKSASTSKIPSPAIPDENQALAASTEAVAIATEKVSDAPPTTMSILIKADQTEQEPRLDQAQSRKIPDRAKFEKTHFQFSTVSEKSKQPGLDSSLNQFNKVSQQARTIPDLTKKIEIWEKYLKIRPEIKSAYMAKYELALLYFQLANEAPTPENVDLALAFYSENVAILFSSPDSIKFKEQFKTLQSLEKK